MQVTRDAGLCEACGQCALVAPDLFRLSPGDDVVTVLLDVVPPGSETTAEDAVGVCPAGALVLR